MSNPDHTTDLFKMLAQMAGRAPTDENAAQLASEISGDCRRRKLAEAVEPLGEAEERRRYLDEVSEALAQERERRRSP
jgi:replicative DNA helicase